MKRNAGGVCVGQTNKQTNKIKINCQDFTSPADKTKELLPHL